MFRRFAKVASLGAQNLFLFHPADLIALSSSRGTTAPRARAGAGHPLHRSDLTRFEDSWFGRRPLRRRRRRRRRRGRCNPTST